MTIRLNLSILLAAFLFAFVPGSGLAQGPIKVCVVDHRTRQPCDEPSLKMNDVKISVVQKDSGLAQSLGGSCNEQGRFDVRGVTPPLTYIIGARATRAGFYYKSDPVSVDAQQGPVWANPPSIFLKKHVKVPVATLRPESHPSNGSYLKVNLIEVLASQTKASESNGDIRIIPTASIAETDSLILPQSSEKRKLNCIIVTSKRGNIAGAKVLALDMDKEEDVYVDLSGDKKAPLTDAHGQFCPNLALDGTYLLTILADLYQPKTLIIGIRKKELFLYKPVDEMDQTDNVEMNVETEADRLRRTVETTPSASEYTRQLGFSDPLIQALPLPGVRTLDSLALLAPGVSPPPETVGGVGLGVSAGVGTAGQFSVNGLRSRENNFTIDGSDNNDEDIGVRRQGFVLLTPLSVENTAQVQVVTALGDTRFGRDIAGQINVLSKSGGVHWHGTAYGFFTGNRLNARDFFDSITGGNPSGQALTRAADHAPVLLDGSPLVARNLTSGENPFRRTQAGLIAGGRLPRTNVFLFNSFERVGIRADRESHFIVPTVKQRGVFGTGETGFIEKSQGGLAAQQLFPATVPGNAIFSLYPFPNNPLGPYGENTYTTMLPADGHGTLFSIRLDREFKGNGKPPSITARKTFFTNYKSYGDHLTGRYNLTNERSTLPVTGGALYSSLHPAVRTQNAVFLFHRILSNYTSDLIRFSLGRTRLSFGEARDPSLLSSSVLPATPFLLNAPLLLNTTRPNADGSPGPTTYVSASSPAGMSLLNSLGYSSITQTEQLTGPLGQVIIPGFSSLGVDVNNFPQTRANNSLQLADTLTRVRGSRIYTFGFELRKTHINSTLDRNFSPLAVFNGLRSSIASPNLPITGPNASPVPTQVFSGMTLAAAGVPTGFFQTLATVADSSVGLRYSQFNIFAQGEWRLPSRRWHSLSNVRITAGLRYELNTVPDTVGQRLEKALDPKVLRTQAEQAANFCNDPVRCSDLVSKLTAAFPANFKISYGADRNDFDTRLGFVWEPLGNEGTVIRGGFGTYSGQFPGIVIDQSRNAFSNFLPLNYANFSPRSSTDNQTFLFNLANPYVQQLAPSLSIITPGKLNTFPSINPIALLANTLLTNQDLSLSTTTLGLDLVLPQRELKTPYSLQSSLTIERRLRDNYILSAAYVWTRGFKLLEIMTPDLGLNNSRLDETQATIKVGPLSNASSFPFFQGRLLPAQSSVISSSFTIARTLFASHAMSSYHSLQLEIRKRYSANLQFGSSFTYAHAIDNASDFFDTAGAFALPQNSNRLSEKASSNFDVRLRSASHFIYDLPTDPHLFKHDGWLGNWQLAGIVIAQTGQPYTVNSAFDINRDGNLTDRLNSVSGIIHGDGRVQLRLAPGGNPFSLLAPDGLDGAVGRNTFRAPHLFTFDLALTKNFQLKFSAHTRFQFRTEIFNLFNRANYGIPIRILESPGFGTSTSTLVPARMVQFSGKFQF